MPAPTLQHEHRREFLGTIATLAGYTVASVLDDECRPDVVRVDTRRARLLVGDAKDTENPSCPATARRLRRYAKSAASWSRTGFLVRFAICHARVSESERWFALLREVVQEAKLTPLAAGTTTFDDMTIVTWVEAIA